MNIFPWEQGEKPYFINELGVEWYIDEFTTKYIRKDTLNNKGIDNIYCFFIKESNGNISRVLIDDKQNLLYENQSLEAIAVFIDLMKVEKGFNI